MRPLVLENKVFENSNLKNVQNNKNSQNETCFEKNLKQLKEQHHSSCMFNNPKPLVPDLNFTFHNSGKLSGRFTCDNRHQGYDNMVHGGVIAAIIDASMAQCLMGHGVVGYTTDLSIKYRKPVIIGLESQLETIIETINIGSLFTMKCEITQNKKRVVHAKGRFFKVKSEPGNQ